MNYKYPLTILCICMLLSAAGCNSGTKVKAETEKTAETLASTEQNQEKSIDEHDYYEDILAAVKECRENPTLPRNYDFSNVLITSRDDEILGYLIEDIDNNGTDELIFGENSIKTESLWDGVIYDIYTVSDGELIHVLNGWERSRYYLCENEFIANEGSSGAANFSYTYYTYKDSKLNFVESIIHDGTKDADNPWFYSTESDHDTKNAVPISEERSKEIRQNYTYKHPTFIPFAKNN